MCTHLATALAQTQMVLVTGYSSTKTTKEATNIHERFRIRVRFVSLYIENPGSPACPVTPARKASAYAFASSLIARVLELRVLALWHVA